MVDLDMLQRWLLRIGVMISAILLIRFAIDFSMEMPWWLAAPFWLVVGAALAVSAINVFDRRASDRAAHSGVKAEALMLAAIPLGFLASSLDCTGLSLQGCSPFCTFIKLVWIPLIAAVCLVYYFTSKPAWLTIIILMSFVALVPHCVCYNVGNGWWIDGLGASPLCYGWGFVVSVITVSALRGRVSYWPSLLVSLTIVLGATTFFVSHHYFSFPW
jgi:hypothetical protein